MRLLVGLILLSSQVFAQHIYWVEFKSKDSVYATQNPKQYLSDKAIARRQKFNIPVSETDLPVSTSNIYTLEQKGYTVLAKSKWLNAVAIKVSDYRIANTLKEFSFVKNATYLGEHKTGKTSKRQHIDFSVAEVNRDSKRNKPDTNVYGKTFKQINMLNADMLHKQGLYGDGVDIAVIDAGFNNVDTLPVFKELVQSERIKLTRDFVQNDNSVYEDDDHGTAVLSCMAGYLPNVFVGTAPMANYYLLRSENANSEMPIEETYWIEAVEFADSLGIDLVNSSLGYNEFDDMAQNITYKDLDGKTSIISKAAAMAVQKGMVVVVSAGNEGDEDWKFICVPADVAEVITVGGVTANENLANFSSIGPTADKRIKPDLMAQGDNVWVASSRGALYQGDGTSYSSPIMAGAIACLMQAHPTKTPQQIMAALHTSGSNYFKPDKYIGYGIPNMQLTYLLLQNDTTNAILDVQYLNDKRVHIALSNSAQQKVNIAITNETGEEVYSETVLLKETGATRFALKKNKHLRNGKHSLHITNNAHSLVQPFSIP